MNILVVDSAPPCDLFQGNALIGWHLFSRLRHHDLTLICPAPAQELERYHATLSQVFSTVHLVPRDEPVNMLTGIVEPFLARSGMPASKRATYSAVRAFQNQVRRVLASKSFDIIHTRQLSTTAMTAEIKHPAKLLELIDSETLQSVRRVSARAPRTWLRFASARFLERRALRHYAACTTVADADAGMVRALAPLLPVHVTPNGVDATFFGPLDRPERPATIVFTGTMFFRPNVTAVLHFYQQILPLIRREQPDAHFVVVGRDPVPEIAALSADPHVTITGFVDDVRPWLAESCVMVCPMIMGSGIKNKVLEALDVTDGRDLRVADSPAEFAAAVLELLGDPAARRRLGQAGRDLVMRRYTWDACAASYDAIYAELATRRDHAPKLAPLRDKAY